MKILAFPEIVHRRYNQHFGLYDETVHTKNKAHIAIYGTEETPMFKKDHPNAISIQFDDIEYDIGFKEPKPILFDSAMADKIIDFIEANKNRDVIIISCAAGISRSGAVGFFTSKLFNLEEDFLKDHAHRIIPNKHVMDILESRFKERQTQK